MHLDGCGIYTAAYYTGRPIPGPYRSRFLRLRLAYICVRFIRIAYSRRRGLAGLYSVLEGLHISVEGEEAEEDRGNRLREYTGQAKW